MAKACALIVLPDDTAKPLIDAIDGAAKSLRIKAFDLSVPSLAQAVVAARRRGVKTRVLLNPGPRDAERADATRYVLERAGVRVKNTNPAYAMSHENSLVIDDRLAIVTSFNWTLPNFSETRDYGVITTCERDAILIRVCFDADWERRNIAPTPARPLLWSPQGARERICDFIDTARTHLVVQNESFEDLRVLDALLRAARRGVTVHVMAKAPHTLAHISPAGTRHGLGILRGNGIEVRELRGLNLQAKMILVDGIAAIIGSMDLSSVSLDSRGELGIEVRDAGVAERLRKVAGNDWNHSQPMDLSGDTLVDGFDPSCEHAA